MESISHPISTFHYLAGFSIKADQCTSITELYEYCVKEAQIISKAKLVFIYLLNKNDNFHLEYRSIDDGYNLREDFKRSSVLTDSKLDPAKIELGINIQSGKHIVPLLKGGRIYGFVGIIDGQYDFVFEEGFVALNTINRMCQIISMIAINRRVRERFSLLTRIFTHVRSLEGKKKILQYIIDGLCSAESKLNAGIIHLYDEVDHTLYGYVSAGIDKKMEGSSKIEIEQTPVGKVFIEGNNLVIHLQETNQPFSSWASKNGFYTMITFQLKGKHENPIGALSFFTKYPFVMEGDDKEFFDTLLNNISIVIDILFYEKKTEKLSSSDNIISQLLSLDKSVEIILSVLLREILEDLHGEIGYISLFSKTSDSIKSFYKEDRYQRYPNFNLPETLQVSLDNSILEYVVKNKKGYLYPSNAVVDKLKLRYTGIPEDEIKNELLVPMIYDEQVIGILVLSSSQKHTFDTQDLDFLETTANKAAQVIQNKIFYDASKILIEDILEFVDEKKICQVTAEITSKVLSTSATIVWIIKKNDDDEEYLSFEGWNCLQPDNPNYVNIQREPGSLEWTIIDLARDEKFDYESPPFEVNSINPVNFRNDRLVRQFALKSMLCIPIANGKDVIGLIATFTNRKYDFFGTEKVLLKSIANRCASAIAILRLNARNEDLRDRWAMTNVVANPGIVALSFVHDIFHVLQYITDEFNTVVGYIPNNVRSQHSTNAVLYSMAEHLNSLRKSFSSLVRMGKQTKTVKKAIYLREIIDDVEHLFGKRFKDGNIAFSKYMSDKEMKLHCYRNEIEQVLVNLIFNSIWALRNVKHRKKEIHIKCIEITYNGKPGVKIEVSDNGTGIAKEHMNRVYNIDFSTKGDEGSGFGLTICKRILENHGGAILHTSIQEVKTTFYLYLPNQKDS